MGKIRSDWNNVDSIMSRIQERQPELRGHATREGLEGLLQAFEPLPVGGGEISAVLGAKGQEIVPVAGKLFCHKASNAMTASLAKVPLAKILKARPTAPVLY